jgi:hypothetical protein
MGSKVNYLGTNRAGDVIADLVEESFDFRLSRILRELALSPGDDELTACEKSEPIAKTSYLFVELTFAGDGATDVLLSRTTGLCGKEESEEDNNANNNLHVEDGTSGGRA